MTASDARKNWFRVLDEAAAGEVVVVERAGTRILIQRDPNVGVVGEVPDYGAVVRGPDLTHADAWSWDRDAEGGDLVPSDPGEELA